MSRSPKIGATALSGYFRQGLAELRAAAPYADSSISQPTNYAMPGVATPGEIAEARRDDGLGLQPPEIAPAERDVRSPDRDDRGMDLD